jgi:hypothetical protein
MKYATIGFASGIVIGIASFFIGLHVVHRMADIVGAAAN